MGARGSREDGATAAERLLDPDEEAGLGIDLDLDDAIMADNAGARDDIVLYYDDDDDAAMYGEAASNDAHAPTDDKKKRSFSPAALFRALISRLRPGASKRQDDDTAPLAVDSDEEELAAFELGTARNVAPIGRTASAAPARTAQQKLAASTFGGEGMVLIPFDAAQSVADPAELHEARATERRLDVLEWQHHARDAETPFKAVRRLLWALARTDRSLWRRCRTRALLLFENATVALRLAPPELRAHVLTLAYCRRHRLTYAELAQRAETAPMTMRTLVQARIVQRLADLEHLRIRAADLVAVRHGQPPGDNAAAALNSYFGEPGCAFGRRLLSAAEWRRDPRWTARHLIVLGADRNVWPPLLDALRWTAADRTREAAAMAGNGGGAKGTLPPALGALRPWLRGSDDEWRTLGIDARVRDELGWEPAAPLPPPPQAAMAAPVSPVRLPLSAPSPPPPRQTAPPTARPPAAPRAPVDRHASPPTRHRRDGDPRKRRPERDNGSRRHERVPSLSHPGNSK